MKTFRIKKILLPTDFSKTAGNALRQAIQIAKINKAGIKLVHIITPAYLSAQTSIRASTGNAFYKKLITASNAEFKNITEEIKESSLILLI